MTDTIEPGTALEHQPPGLDDVADRSADGLSLGADAPPRNDDGMGSFLDNLRAYKDLRRTPYGLTPALVFASIGFFQQLDTFAFRLATPDFIQAGVSVNSIVGIIVTIGALTLVSSLIVGWWADRHSRVPLFGIGTMLAGIAGMFTGVRITTAGVGGARVADETFNAVADVPSYSLLADYYPPETRGRVFSMLGSLSKVGQLVALPIAALLVLNFGLRNAFIILGAPIALMGLFALIRLREPIRGYFERQASGADEDASRREDEPQSFGESWRTVFAVRTMRRLFIADIVTAFVSTPAAFFFGLFIVEQYGLDIGERALYFIPGIVCGLIGGVYGGGLVDRFTTRNPGRVLAVYGAFGLISALGYIAYAFKPPLIALVVANSLVSFGAALVGPALGAVYSQVIPPSVRTLGLQMTQLAVVPTLLFGFPLGSLVRSEYGYEGLFFYAAPIIAIGAVITMSSAGFFDLDRRSAIATSVAAEEWRIAQREGRGKLLVCKDVDVAYDGVQVLFGVDFELEEGEIVALLGTNGAGKSTLLRAISGTQEASSGAVIFDGRDITHMPPHEIADRHVVHMPGGRGTFPGLTVRDNLVLGNWLNDDPSTIRSSLEEVFDIFPILRERANEPASALSGGEQQQLSLAQAFLMKPKLLMIDELSLGLSPAVVGQLLEIVRAINARGVAIIVVEQSVNVALNLADRAVFMEKGEVKFNGRTADLLSRPDILRAVYVKGTGAITDGAPSSAARREQDQRALELSSARPILEATGITKTFGGISALSDVSLALREGEVLGIIGPNGSGKTTLFDIISGYQPADEGTITYEGIDITSMRPEERAKRKLVRRFQDARLFPSLTVYETLLISLEQRLEVRNTFLQAVSAPQARRAERRVRVRADRLLELLELGAYRDKFVRELSTGLRRIVDLACVLAAEPKVLLLDEPSSGIAQAEAEGLAPLLRRVRFETGCSIMIIEHDMPLISAVSDELIALERGQFVVRGSAEEVLNDDRVIESYLGGSDAAVKRSGSL